MVITVHRPLKVVAINANGIGRQAYELRKQMQDLKIDMFLFSETHLKPHMRLYIPNYHIYRNDCQDGQKAELTLQSKRASHILTLLALPPLLSVEATGSAYLFDILKCCLHLVIKLRQECGERRRHHRDFKP
jgi:hypothetical protein